jgi:hypothetical protein
MDAIQNCLAIVPVPCLQAVFTIFKALYLGIQNAKASKTRLKVLAACVAELLTAINRQYAKGKLTVRGSAQSLEGLAK